MKLLSVCIPCYNSEAYMEKCINSLLSGGDDMELIIVNDGSSDRTAEIADHYQEQYPGIVRAVHKENGGHGSAVNAGIRNATGLFFKVVDSDDWVKESALTEVLECLRKAAGASEPLDMLISNFVYDKTGENRHKVMQYRSSLPVGRMFTWSDIRPFRKGHYILMHSVIFRTAVLRESGMELPEHCFYVDNIYVFEPVLYVKNMYYLDVNFYHYYIGRSDQSVNEKVMISRLDQQMKVNRIMVDFYTDKNTRTRMQNIPMMKEYLYHYLEIITTISSVLALCSYTKEHMEMKDELWKYIKSRDRALYRRLRLGIFGMASNAPGKGGRYITVSGYRIVRHFFNFS